ncbi:MAG: hypothetical protein ACK45B_06585 [Limisphaerales bacterium]
MDVIKKHWEKILLGVVLVGLAGVALWLPFKIGAEKADLEEVRNRLLAPRVEPLPPLSFTEFEALLARAQAPLNLDFGTGHRLFNPVLWQRRSDGTPFKVETGREVGPGAIVPVRTTPLFTIISLDNVTTNESGARYAIGLERQAAPRVADRRKRQQFVSVGQKTEFFSLRSVRGPAADPEALVLEWNETGEEMVVGKDRPFRRVDGYLADLRYPPENRLWSGRRVGDRLTFGGEEYNIVAITETEVVLSARSGKKTTVRVGATP